MRDLEMFELTGRVAVVTGAASGIGRATAELLAAVGASVVCGDVHETGARETASTIEAAGGTAIAVGTDVARRDDVVALVRTATDRFGRLDIMCNVAGIMHQSLVVETEEADLDRVLAVNLKGVFYGCQEAAKAMMARLPKEPHGGSGYGRSDTVTTAGSIVNMVSSAIDAPAPGIVAYAMSKAAVAQLTRTMAVEMGRYRIRVNAVAPGFVITGMTSRHFQLEDGSLDEDRREAVVSAMGKMAPLRRVGEPMDIARAVLYLASDASGFVTGQVLRVNGGVSMP